MTKKKNQKKAEAQAKKSAVKTLLSCHTGYISLQAHI